MIEQTGGCLCGDVRFKLNGAPYEIDYCHCHSCRKHTGPFPFPRLQRWRLEFTKGAPTLFRPEFDGGSARDAVRR